jgi:hypothetical protein
MTVLDDALDLVRRGFWVFPARHDDKKPKIKEWQHAATQDEAVIRGWFAVSGDRPPLNIGVSTGKFDQGRSLLVVDVDVKNGKDGNRALLQLELEGHDLPDTLTAETASGGRHLFFSVETAVRQGADVLGTGLDVRSRGGYVLGVGSSIDGKPYRWLLDTVIQPAPAWLIERCGVSARVRDRRQDQEPIQVDRARALSRAREYLLRDAPLAVEGEAGDETTYKVATRVKDFGVDEGTCLDLLLSEYNPRCNPPWSADDLGSKVRNAYAYGLERPGAAAPESDFAPVVGVEPSAENVGHPLAWLNDEHAYIMVGKDDAVLRETVDADGRFELKLMSVPTFHRKWAAKKWQPSKKIERQTEGWMEWSHRREYEGLVFLPGIEAPADRYNLWRGFTPLAEPADLAAAQDALDRYLGHVRDNVCCGDAKVYNWVVGFMAHLVQKPWEKPHVALVIRGLKGTGKNFFIERICDLIASHAMVVARKRFLTGNFTAHLERLLLFVLDEAFWSGDKEIEGILKDLITGSHHQIEKKGLDSYTVRNLTRIVILGNEEWLVPASQDERRFCVLNVGNGRRQDTAFFQKLKADLDAGGNYMLLKYLQSYDLTGFDVNKAPDTDGLLDQKLASLPPFEQWWLDCLTQSRMVGGDFGEDWPTDVAKDRLRKTVRMYLKDRNITGRLPTDVQIGKIMHDLAPAMKSKQVKGQGYVYVFPSVDECRAEFERHLGRRMVWPE